MSEIDKKLFKDPVLKEIDQTLSDYPNHFLRFLFTLSQLGHATMNLPVEYGKKIPGGNKPAFGKTVSYVVVHAAVALGIVALLAGCSSVSAGWQEGEAPQLKYETEQLTIKAKIKHDEQELKVKYNFF